MKSFLQYLTESKHDYSFRIRFAGKPETGVAKNIKAALAGFGVKSVGDVKSHVVERSHPMFPGLANPEIYSVDVVCEYPATAYQIRKSLTDFAVDKATVAVENLDHSEDMATEMEQIAANSGKEPLLLKDYEQAKAEHPYGDSYNAKLVKNSVTGTGRVKVKGGSAAAKTTNELPQGNKSAMGSVKPKLPDVKSYRR